jgi:outer membrane protein OmpA-like peptidoglycan-associated protein
MNISRLTASLVALALFAMPVMAEDDATEVEQPAAEQPQEVPAEVLVLLSDSRPASDLTDDELKLRFQQTEGFLKLDGLTADMKQSLQAMAMQDRNEIADREAMAANKPSVTDETQTQTEVQHEKPADKALPVGAQVPDDVMAFIKDDRTAAELSDDELLARVKTARKFSQNNKLPEETRSELENILKAARTEALVRGQGGKKPVVEGEGQTEEQVAAVPTDQKQVQALDGNKSNPGAEAKAKAFLDDPVTADKLSDADLSARLDGMRDLMAGNQLSSDTERALRRKLRAERDVLRSRVAEAEDKKSGVDSGTGGKKNSKPKDEDNFNITIVLGDRRPSGDLDDFELRRRIDVYRDAAYDDQYDDEERIWWQRTIERDRRVLRQRMIDERRLRARQLEDDDDFDIELGMDFDAGRRQRDVFAAEVDDEELEEVLASAPRRRFDRRYSVEEFESSPELRDALPRIEIDTVHFGFGEAFVREEEVENLDRIAEIMEKILARHPRELFLVEGHTDAVGSNASNLTLSRQRARAIKEALTTYYVIAPENVETVGYGERYLKIPTAEAEAENRRVSVARATSVMGELDE